MTFLQLISSTATHHFDTNKKQRLTVSLLNKQTHVPTTPLPVKCYRKQTSTRWTNKHPVENRKEDRGEYVSQPDKQGSKSYSGICLSWERNTENELRDINLDVCTVRRPSADGGGIVIMPVRLPLPLNDRHRAITIMFVEHSVIKSCRRLLSLSLSV